MSFIVGLTGGIGSGKTTVANIFHQQFGIDIVDADVIAREVVAAGSYGLKQISEHFGQSVVNCDGSLNRAELRELIFSDSQNKSWLDQLLHPLIRERMKQEIDLVNTPYALLVVPLLIENQLQSMTDRVLVVDVSAETQIQRTITRDSVSKQQVMATIQAQASREQRLKFADDTILNDNGQEVLISQIAQLHKKYLALSNQSSIKRGL